METNKANNSEKWIDKVKRGLDLSFKRLVEQKRKTGGSLVFFENGKVVKVKASDIKI
jgi:hypothetical protein